MGTENAVYRFYDLDDHLLYVGVTWNPSLRFEQHRAEKHWFGHVARADVEWYPTRAIAEDEEARAIWLEAPVHNVAQPLSRDQRIVRGAMELEPALRALWISYRRAETSWDDVVARLPQLVGPGRMMPSRSADAIDMTDAILDFLGHLEESWAREHPEPEHGFLADAYTLEVVMDLFLARRTLMT
jgi:hypothetical protein